MEVRVFISMEPLPLSRQYNDAVADRIVALVAVTDLSHLKAAIERVLDAARPGKRLHISRSLARKADPVTSRIAAAMVDSTKYARIVLEIFGAAERPLNALEVERRAAVKVRSIHQRMHDLRVPGLIEAVGVDFPHGRPCNVYVITAKGRNVLAGEPLVADPKPELIEISNPSLMSAEALEAGAVSELVSLAALTAQQRPLFHAGA
jgi:hypothetical protein